MDSIWLLLEILVINLVLSGDNAVVIAMSTQHLPEKERKVAVWWGAAGAVILRLLLTIAAMWLMGIPLLQAAGGVMLFAIAIQLLAGSGSHVGRKEGIVSLASAIRTILVADVVMSLDNVLAIAAVSQGHLPYLIAGIAISIPIVVWGSTLISLWLTRFPILIYAGAGILGYTAGEMIASDTKLRLWMPELWLNLHVMLPWVLTAMVLIAGYWIKRQTCNTVQE
ncbi:TerC family protein [Paenibacillus sp. ACRRX]|uniref:TerC family protein n=1 Tax=Paenibacillus sp. ACRRX TaxID=2918206 RepID=UPI001EF5AD33|nr:TerC family protein [Paenibacillus sp. ACRRX]